MSLVAGAFFVSLCGGMDSPAHAAPSACDDAAELAFLPSPIAPWKGAPLRVLFAAEKPLEGEMRLIAPDGSIAAQSRERHGGPPYFWFAEIKSPAAGTWHAVLVRDQAPSECSTITREIKVRPSAPPRPGTVPGSTWPLRNTWSQATENLFSAWIEKLFDDPLDAEPSWTALHLVLRDRSRNFLFNHLGLGEDEMKIVAASRLRRPSVLPARLFRVQDGAAVRFLKMLARRRRQAALLPAMVQHSKCRRRASAAPAPAGSSRDAGRAATTASSAAASAETPGSGGGVQRSDPNRLRQRPLRFRADRAER